MTSARFSWSLENLEPDFPADVENDRDEDLWRPLLAIADTLGGEVPALARRAMLELIAVGHEQSVGEELMAAIYDILTEELVVHPRSRQIALPRLVGLVNRVEGPWSEYRGGLGYDSRGLSRQLKTFDLIAKPVRDPVHIESAARGYNIHDLLVVSRPYRADVEDAEEKPFDPRSEKSSTS